MTNRECLNKLNSNSVYNLISNCKSMQKWLDSEYTDDAVMQALIDIAKLEKCVNKLCEVW